jgi:NRPS condensation-like uncharacterized protein
VYDAQWSRLDNAAKIFPPSTSKADTKVFRFSCELYEPVDPEILQHALDTSLEEFPFYRFIIRRGLFWYYFEKSDLQPEVREEYKSPCALLYDVSRRNLLFELTYYRKRINLEIYHALSDGIGAVEFLKAIVCQYLLEKHRETLTGESIQLHDDGASDEQRSRDAFDTYYSKGKAPKIPRLPQAYRIRGERFPESRLGIIEGHVSLAALLKKTHESNATLSEFLTAVLIYSIHEGMKLRDETRPVSIAVPVNLRKYFTTLSVRNFFSIVNVSHNFSVQEKDFDGVLSQVKSSFKTHLSPENIHERFNHLVSLEHAPYIKMVPLAVKAPVLKQAAWRAGKGTSAAFSNIGKISMPEKLIPYVHLFNVFNSTRRLQLCVCSFEDVLSMSFSTSFVSSDIQRSFFHALADRGLAVEVVSNVAELQETANPRQIQPLSGGQDAAL